MTTSFTSSKMVGKNIPPANSNPVQVDIYGGKAVFSLQFFPALLRSVLLDALFGSSFSKFSRGRWESSSDGAQPAEHF